MLIDYTRTSAVEQVAGLEAQETALAATRCNKLFSEQASSVAQRDQLTAALAHGPDAVADIRGCGRVRSFGGMQLPQIATPQATHDAQCSVPLRFNPAPSPVTLVP